MKGGVIAGAGIVDRRDVHAMLRLSNDAFVRFVEDFRGDGVMTLPASCPTARGPNIAVGVCGAVDVMLSTVESNRGQHGDWLDLTIFSTVLCGNFRRYADDGRAIGRPMTEAHAVRPSVIARVLGLAETTVRPRTARLTQPGQSLIQVRRGLMVSQAWLATVSAAATTARTQESVRREIRKAVLRGFPLDAPATAYMDGRPPLVDFA